MPYKHLLSWTAFGVAASLALPGLYAQDPASYLPLAEGNRWVLKHKKVKKPVIFEVLGRDGDGFKIRFDSPFGSNDWKLVQQGGKFSMTQFGKNGHMMDLPEPGVYFDFESDAGHSWKMTAGQMKVMERGASVESWGNVIRISQGKGLVFAFAPSVGFVQFGEGKNAFTLVPGESRLPGSSGGGSAPPSASNRPADDSRPVQHVQTGGPASNATANAARITRNFPSRGRNSGPMRIGITVNTYANESLSPQNLLARWQQSIDSGVNFVVHNGKWDELEPKKGDYKLDGLNFQVSEAEKHNMEIAYTLRLIDTVSRTMPSDLKSRRWTDREMESRVIKLVEALAPRFKGRVKWFMFGNEIDGYFGKHPNEIAEYAQLYDKVAKRLRELVPGILVSSTIMYGGIETLNGNLAPLNDRWDFLAITYYPIRGDFTMKDPGIVASDFNRMRQASEGRGVILQEIGYASSATNASNQDKQAQFVKNVFDQMRAHRDVFDGGSFFLLADLSDQFVKNLAGFYGMPDTKTFLAFLQTTGLYDLQGRPKKAWSVFQSEIKHLR